MFLYPPSFARQRPAVCYRMLLPLSLRTCRPPPWAPASHATSPAPLPLPRPRLPAGTIKPGYSKVGSDTLDIVSAFQSFGGYAAGLISEEQRCDIVRNACPGPGARACMQAIAMLQARLSQRRSSAQPLI